jgi:hypothetical protein
MKSKGWRTRDAKIWRHNNTNGGLNARKRLHMRRGLDNLTGEKHRMNNINGF